jgi:recombination protein RecA
MSYAELIKKKQKEWGCASLMNAIYEVQGERIPFSSPLMNWFTYGGVPRNKIIEIFGSEGSGKSTVCQDLCRNAAKIFQEEYDKKILELQERVSAGDKSASDELEEMQELGPKKVLYVDIEHSFDVSWARTLGLDLTQIDVMQPPNIYGEDVLQTIREIVQTGEVGMVILDSLPALTPKAVLEKKIGERTVAALAGLLNTFYPLIVPLLTRYHCTLVCVNQVRENMVNPYVVNTPGGNAPKFYASLRICMRKGKPIDFLGNELPQNTENPAGCIIQATLYKQKTAPNDRKMGTFYLMFQTGIRPDFDYATLAIKNYGLIKKSGGWYTFVDPETGEVLRDEVTGKDAKVNGLGKVYDFLQTNERYYKKLQDYIMADINGRTDVVDGEETN